MDNIKVAEAFWNTLAEDDPLWAILSDPTRRGGGWDLGTFFRTGEREISTLIYQLERLLGAPKVQRHRALDFGCGVGRLTQALATYYSEVVGLDISSRMIEHARRLNRCGARVTYVHNNSSDLSILNGCTFDLIYSDLVFQHMPPAQALAYIDECLTLLSPQGILVFQLPSHSRQAQPSSVVPMPASAYRARIEIVKAPERWSPGLIQQIDVRVVNDSDGAWDQANAGVIRLGNHWLSPDSTMLIQDDGRTDMPRLMQPGQVADATLEVTVPVFGRHILELDLVHEGYSWFADRGSRATRLSIDTVGPAVSEQPVTEREAWDDSLLVTSSGTASAVEIAFPMYGIPQTELLSFVASRGADVFFVEEDDRGGREWAGFRYFIRR